MSDDKKHYHGHRDRLRQRFLTKGAEALSDYELLELILFAAIPRRDVKPLAKELLAYYDGIWHVTQANTEELRDKFKLSDTSVCLLKAISASALRMSLHKIMEKPIFQSWDDLIKYCQGAMSHEDTERFRILFLDNKHKLIADEVQQKGTVDHTPVYPREVVKRALELAAGSLILVHNHPSGDPSPSRADIEMTKKIKHALDAVDITLHDHLIIGKGEHTSFKTLGLL